MILDASGKPIKPLLPKAGLDFLAATLGSMLHFSKQHPPLFGPDGKELYLGDGVKIGDTITIKKPGSFRK